MLQENILKEGHMWVKNSRKLWNIGQRIQHSKQRIPQSSMPNEHPSVLDIISLSEPLDNKEILHLQRALRLCGLDLSCLHISGVNHDSEDNLFE